MKKVAASREADLEVEGSEHESCEKNNGKSSELSEFRPDTESIPEEA